MRFYFLYHKLLLVEKDLSILQYLTSIRYQETRFNFSIDTRKLSSREEQH